MTNNYNGEIKKQTVQAKQPPCHSSPGPHNNNQLVINKNHSKDHYVQVLKRFFSY